MRKKTRTNSFMSAHEDEVTLTQAQPRPQIVVGEGNRWTPLPSPQRFETNPVEFTMPAGRPAFSGRRLGRSRRGAI